MLFISFIRLIEITADSFTLRTCYTSTLLSRRRTDQPKPLFSFFLLFFLFPKQFTVRGSKCCKGMATFQPGCFWSGLWLPLLYLRVICLPVWVPLVGSSDASALSSNHLSPGLGASGRAFGCFCSIFGPFVSQPGWLWSGALAASALSSNHLSSNHLSPAWGCLWSGLWLFLLYLRIICLPAWVPLVGPSAVAALSSNHLSPSSSGLRLALLYLRTICFPAWVPLVGPPGASALSSNHLSPSLDACGRVSGSL